MSTSRVEHETRDAACVEHDWGESIVGSARCLICNPPSCATPRPTLHDDGVLYGRITERDDQGRAIAVEWIEPGDLITARGWGRGAPELGEGEKGYGAVRATSRPSERPRPRPPVPDPVPARPGPLRRLLALFR